MFTYDKCSRKRMMYFYASFLKKWAYPGLFLFIFILFLLQFQYKLKKHRWCAWDSNPGLQDGRRRWNHGAMAATHSFFILMLFAWNASLKRNYRFICSLLAVSQETNPVRNKTKTFDKSELLTNLFSWTKC